MVRGNPKISNKSNVTLSVDNQILSDIKVESERLGTSINAIIGKILLDHVMFGKYIAEDAPVIIAPPIFSLLLESVDEQRFLQAWEIALNEITPTILTLHNIEVTLDNVIKHIFSDIGLRSGLYTKVLHTTSAENTTLTFNHRYGMKWSRIISTSHTEYLKKIFDCTVFSEIFPNVVVVKINGTMK